MIVSATLDVYGLLVFSLFYFTMLQLASHDHARSHFKWCHWHFIDLAKN
jgi:hypothetical protein